MKKTIKSTKVALIALLITTFSCNKDDDPVIINLQNLEVTLDENPIEGDVIGTIQSDNNASMAFSITSQTPNGALEINESTGELTIADATLFDYEVNPTITATVAADKAQNTATVTIIINNTNELSIQDYTTTIDENPTNGQSLGTVEASGDGVVSFSITSQTPVDAVSIDSNTGELTVANAILFDFETNPTITASIVVDNSGNTQILTATINLNNVNELSIQDFTATIDENPTNGDPIGTVQASGDGTLSFSITSQVYAGALSIDQSTGELTVADATLFDFEMNQTITATISVDNNSGNVQTATVTITLTDAHEVGEFKFGGVIFWVNDAGDEGLVCAPTDQSTGIRWHNGSNFTTGATATEIGSGETNTTTIVNAQGAGSYAAQTCDDLNLNGYDDWFLPSKDELYELLNNKAIVDAAALANSGSILATQYYWSSSETSSSNAAVYWEPNGNVYYANGSKSTSIYHVRAVRSWTDF